MNREPIYQYIQANLTADGDLPDSFSLGDKYGSKDAKIKWADGALDGVLIYHSAAPDITSAQYAVIDEALMCADNIGRAAELMDRLFEKVPPIRAIDAIQQRISENLDRIDHGSLIHFALDRLQSDSINGVKLALIITEGYRTAVYGENEWAVKQIIRTLGLCDEFTIFVIFNMMRWEDGGDQIFDLAQKVHGWGRIHAAGKLDPKLPGAREWLLAEGINNTVMPQYSALIVYYNADIPGLLAGGATDEQLGQAAAVILAMFDEGPVGGISCLTDEEEAGLCADFADSAEKMSPLTEPVKQLLRTFAESERSAAYAGRCRALLGE